jgi:hypothetical protein
MLDSRPLIALVDIAEGRDPQCLVAPTGDDSLDCTVEEPCQACRAGAAVDELRGMLVRALGAIADASLVAQIRAVLRY